MDSKVSSIVARAREAGNARPAAPVTTRTDPAIVHPTSREDRGYMVELDIDIPHAQRVYAFLERHGPSIVKTISDRISMPPMRVANALRQLEEKQSVARDGHQPVARGRAPQIWAAISVPELDEVAAPVDTPPVTTEPDPAPEAAPEGDTQVDTEPRRTNSKYREPMLAYIREHGEATQPELRVATGVTNTGSLAPVINALHLEGVLVTAYLRGRSPVYRLAASDSGPSDEVEESEPTPHEEADADAPPVGDVLPVMPEQGTAQPLGARRPPAGGYKPDEWDPPSGSEPKPGADREQAARPARAPQDESPTERSQSDDSIRAVEREAPPASGWSSGVRPPSWAPPDLARPGTPASSPATERSESRDDSTGTVAELRARYLELLFQKAEDTGEEKYLDRIERQLERGHGGLLAGEHGTWLRVHVGGLEAAPTSGELERFFEDARVAFERVFGVAPTFERRDGANPPSSH